jgi:pimeloyl-ACP methyl ester carboxylesterase
MEAIDQDMMKLAQTNVKTLVLVGDQDRIVDIGASEQWWNRWGLKVKVIVRDGVGHLMFLEEPDITSWIVIHFLQSAGKKSPLPSPP